MEEDRNELKWVRRLMCFPHVPQSWFRHKLYLLYQFYSVCVM